MENDLSKLTVKKLQAQLRKLGLKVSGNKADLIQRIQVRDFLTGVTDPDREILLNLNAEDLLNACKTSKYATELCADEKFLRLRVERNYEGDAENAFIEASKYGDLLFMEYLSEYITYDAVLDTLFKAYDHGRFAVVRNMVKHNLLYVVDAGANYGTLKMMKYIIETAGEMNIGADEDTMTKYGDIILFTKESADSTDKDDDCYDIVPYLDMLMYLYQNLGKDEYLRLLKQLAKRYTK